MYEENRKKLESPAKYVLKENEEESNYQIDPRFEGLPKDLPKKITEDNTFILSPEREYKSNEKIQLTLKNFLREFRKLLNKTNYSQKTRQKIFEILLYILTGNIPNFSDFSDFEKITQKNNQNKKNSKIFFFNLI